MRCQFHEHIHFHNRLLPVCTGLLISNATEVEDSPLIGDLSAGVLCLPGSARGAYWSAIAVDNTPCTLHVKCITIRAHYSLAFTASLLGSARLPVNAYLLRLFILLPRPVSFNLLTLQYIMKLITDVMWCKWQVPGRCQFHWGDPVRFSICLLA